MPTPRQVAREQTLDRIKTLALAQLGDRSAGELSLRAIARDLGIVSSAIYRYYPSRDDLLTDLIVDGYGDLAEHIEAVTASGRSPRRRFTKGCDALREWARAQPERFGLLYGTAVPGYAAPERTIEPAGRVARAVVAPVADAPAPTPRRTARRLAAQEGALREALDLDLPAGAGVAVAGVLAQLIGFVTLELGGHFVGTFDPADDLWAAVVDSAANTLGC